MRFWQLLIASAASASLGAIAVSFAQQPSSKSLADAVYVLGGAAVGNANNAAGVFVVDQVNGRVLYCHHSAGPSGTAPECSAWGKFPQ